MAARAHNWEARITAELAVNEVCWHGNVTTSVVEDARIDARIASRRETRELTPSEMFQLRAVEISKGVSVWLKRVREAMKKKGRLGRAPVFSYLIVAEEHRSEHTSAAKLGRPHLHLLLMEKRRGELVLDAERFWSKKDQEWRIADASKIKGLWSSPIIGRFTAKLVEDQRQAVYVAKYLDISMPFRIRASEGFGRDAEPEAARLKQVLAEAEGL